MESHQNAPLRIYHIAINLESEGSDGGIRLAMQRQSEEATRDRTGDDSERWIDSTGDEVLQMTVHLMHMTARPSPTRQDHTNLIWGSTTTSRLLTNGLQTQTRLI